MHGLDERMEKQRAWADRQALAEVWPQLCRAVGNLPPTPAEIEKIKLFGPPPGWNYLPDCRPGKRHKFRTHGIRLPTTYDASWQG